MKTISGILEWRRWCHVRHVPPGGVVTEHLHASSAGMAPCRRAPWLGCGASCSAFGGPWHVVGSLVKTMSDASDWQCWRLVRHIPIEGIVWGFLHAHVAGSLISLRPAVGGRLHLYHLPMLYRGVITMLQLRLL